VLDYTAFSYFDKNESKSTGYLQQQKSELSDSQVLEGEILTMQKSQNKPVQSVS